MFRRTLFWLEAEFEELGYSGRRELQGLGAPLIEPWAFQLRITHAYELIRFSIKEIDACNDRAVRALRECCDVVGRKKRIASETLEDFNVSDDVGPDRNDLTVALNRICRPP